MGIFREFYQGYIYMENQLNEIDTHVFEMKIELVHYVLNKVLDQFLSDIVHT